MKYQTRVLEGSPKPRGPKYAVAIIPVLISALSVAIFAFLIYGWLPQLPEKIATHWGIDGRPNDFQSPWFLVLLVSILILVFVIIGLVVSFGGIKRDIFFKPFVWTNAFVIGMSIWLSISMAGSVYVQLDRDPSSVWVTETLPWMGYGAVAGLVLALIYGFATVRFTDEYTRAPSTSPLLPIAENAHGFWVTRLSAPAFFRWFIYLTLLAIFVLALFLLWEVWVSIVLLVTGLVVVAGALTLSWSIVISEKGFTAISSLGVWRINIPIEKIVSASVADIEPFTDFGGYGLRLNPTMSMFGIVLRKGDALIIERSDKKRSFVVTVDDAETGAGLLNAYVARNR
ncbi:MAG: DUF1648 domain-containing protein [Microbacteriaceae bacterium]|nr:DUF1648 domain-containing protein [Microbacteriaceae bacterium]